MFSNEDFQSWGKDNAVLFAAVMTKIEGREDDDLLRTYGFRGFPSMALLDAEGTKITDKIQRDLFSMQNLVAAAPAYTALKTKVDAGEDVDAAQWFLARLRMGELTHETAQEALPGAQLTAAQRKAADPLLVSLEVTDLMRQSYGRDATPEDELMECVYELFQSGKRVPHGAQAEPFFDDMLVKAAQAHGDAEAFHYGYERVVTALQARVAQIEGFLPRYEADLEKYADDEKMLKRVQSGLERAKGAIDATRKQIEELRETAAKLKN